MSSIENFGADLSSRKLSDNNSMIMRRVQATTAAAARLLRRTEIMSGLTLFEGLLDDDLKNDTTYAVQKPSSDEGSSSSSKPPPSLHDEIVRFVDAMLELGRRGKLPGRTYTKPPPKWVGNKQSREMLQFGVYTNANRVQWAPVIALPPLLRRVSDLLVEKGVVGKGERLDTCCVNVYGVGHWLPPHVDNPSFARPFVTVSLESEQSAVFGEVLTGDNGRWAGGHRVFMPIGSALRVTGEAGGPRVKHAVESPSSRRISLTFRRLSSSALDDMRRNLTGRLLAKWRRVRTAGVDLLSEEKERQSGPRGDAKKDLHRGRNSSKSSPLPQSLATSLLAAENGGGLAMPQAESSHVQQVYDSIASHWNRTRHSPWPAVVDWLHKNGVAPQGGGGGGKLVVDVGCGNGKHLRLCGQGSVGCDVSLSQLSVCQSNTAALEGNAQNGTGGGISTSVDRNSSDRDNLSSNSGSSSSSSSSSRGSIDKRMEKSINDGDMRLGGMQRPKSSHIPPPSLRSLFLADAASALPLRSSSFDLALNIA
eukprot:jgi/Bigna1/83208/fgenesh1_pg.104_\